MHNKYKAILITWSYIQLIRCREFPHFTTNTCRKTTPPQLSDHLCALPGKHMTLFMRLMLAYFTS